MKYCDIQDYVESGAKIRHVDWVEGVYLQYQGNQLMQFSPNGESKEFPESELHFHKWVIVESAEVYEPFSFRDSKFARRCVKSYRHEGNKVTLEFEDGSVEISVRGSGNSKSSFYDIIFDPCNYGAPIEYIEFYTSPKERTIETFNAAQVAGIGESGDFFVTKTWDIIFQTGKGRFVLRHVNGGCGDHSGWDMENGILEFNFRD